MSKVRLHTISSYSQRIFFFLLAVPLIWACSRENFDIVETTTEEIVPEVTYINSLADQMNIPPGENDIRLGCFSIQKPFHIIAQDREQYIVENQEDFNVLFGNVDNPILDFVYPITIQHKNGETENIEGGADLGDAFASCVPTGGWTYDAFPAYVINFENSCYELEFPIKLKQLNGTQKVAEDRQAFNALVAEEAGLYFFDYPLALKSESGEIITIEETTELIDLLVGCSGFDGDGISIDEEGLEIWCYDIQYPIQVLLWNGSKVTVNDHALLCDLMLEGEIVNFVYPFHLLDTEGNAVEITSEYHYEITLWECETYDFRGDEAYLLYLGTEPFRRDACYKIKFPIEVIAYSFGENEGESIILKNITQLKSHVLFGSYQKSEILYPIILKYHPQGLEAEVMSLTHLMNLLEGCF
ncbi:MAG: hypothetical protein AAF806_06090 [Bacteroidota bacterium]